MIKQVQGCYIVSVSGLKHDFLFSQYRLFCYITLILGFHSFQSLILWFIYLTSTVSLITLEQILLTVSIYFLLPDSNCYFTYTLQNILCVTEVKNTILLLTIIFRYIFALFIFVLFQRC